MAKRKKTETSDGKQFSFSQLQKELYKISPDAELLAEDVYSNIESYFSLGNYLLNAQVSGSCFNGAASGRVTVLSGEQGSGKTFLCLNTIRSAQEQGYYIIWIDTENAMDRATMEKFGLDASKDAIDYHPISTVENVINLIVKLTDTLKEAKKTGCEVPKILIVIDSIGNLATDWEFQIAREGVSGKVDMGHKQKLLKRLFRLCVVDCGILKIPIIATNHVYSTMSLYGEPTMSGGCLTENHKVLMNDNTFKNINLINVGDIVKTIDGDKKVLQKFEYEKPTIKLHLSDGSFIECTEEHKFLISENPRIWKKAIELEETDEILMVKI